MIDRIRNWFQGWDTLSFRYVFFFCLLFVAAFSGMINASLTENSEWIGYWGSIAGGIFTLWGVLISIRWSEKHRKKEGLPDQLLAIETARDEVFRSLQELERLSGSNQRLVQPGQRRERLFFVESRTHRESPAYHLYQEEIPARIRGDMIRAGADTYRLYLSFRDQLRTVSGNTNLKARESLSFSLALFAEKGNEEMLARHLRETEAFYQEAEEEYLTAIAQAYRDLSYSLRNHHEKLLKKLDN
ncbi:hypothetical protein [Salinithrix halophila]|uniref:Uncharacterized protein n=1 Tax=Salinithrix halophila TaxID=1485204 RepID=A0ABV8JHR6_9BACL